MINAFGNAIRKRREALGISQQTAAKIAGVTYQTLSKYENGTREPSVFIAQKLAEAYQIPLDYLLSGKTESDDIFQSIPSGKIVEKDVLVDSRQLKKLLRFKDNLPLLFEVSDDAAGDYSTTIIGAENVHCRVGEILNAEVFWNKERIYTDREEFEDDLRDNLADEEYCSALSEDKFESAVEVWKTRYAPYWRNAIIVSITG